MPTHHTKPKSPLRLAHEEWLTSRCWDIALTLDCQPDVSLRSAEKAIVHFWQDVDVWLYGQNQVKRHNRRLPRVVYRQGQETVQNIHFHAAVVLPAKFGPSRLDPLVAGDVARFSAALIDRWRLLKEAGRYGKADACWDAAGWIEYICRDVDRDGETLHLITTTLS